MSGQGQGHDSSSGVVWDEFKTHDNDGRRRYRAWVRVDQDDEWGIPQVSLWTHNGVTPPQALSVEDCVTLGSALLDAAELVDGALDAAIRQVLDHAEGGGL